MLCRRWVCYYKDPFLPATAVLVLRQEFSNRHISLERYLYTMFLFLVRNAKLYISWYRGGEFGISGHVLFRKDLCRPVGFSSIRTVIDCVRKFSRGRYGDGQETEQGLSCGSCRNDFHLPFRVLRRLKVFFAILRNATLLALLYKLRRSEGVLSGKAKPYVLLNRIFIYIC